MEISGYETDRGPWRLIVTLMAHVAVILKRGFTSSQSSKRSVAVILEIEDHMLRQTIFMKKICGCDLEQNRCPDQRPFSIRRVNKYSYVAERG